MTTLSLRIRAMLSLRLRAIAAVLAATLAIAPASFAEMVPTLNLFGQTGLIDMPSGDAQPDGYLGLTHGQFGPIARNTLTFQLTPRLSGSFRYVGIKNWNNLFCPPDCTNGNAFHTYYDRNFDLRYLVLKEGKYLPAFSIGLQDFVGTGLSAAEYMVATKTVGSRLKVTAGLGFGRLGSYGSLAAPFGPRPKVKVGKGGKVNYAQWFRGTAAPFGGLEYQVTDRLSLKAEYSSDAYTEESGLRETFARRSPFNFGVEYQQSPMVRLGLYSLYGSQLAFNVSIVINPGQRPRGGIGGPGPEPILPRPSRVSSPELWTTGWLAQSDVKDVLIGNLKRNLVRTGISIESLGVTGDTAQVRYRNSSYDASAQAAGRVARAMSQTMPASVETFQLVPVVRGMAAAMITIRRSDLEALEFTPDSAAALRARTTITDVGRPLPGTVADPEQYPKFSWFIGPYAQTFLFDPRQPFQSNVGLSFSGRYEIASGVILSGTITKSLFNDVKNARELGLTSLPQVRSHADDYLRLGDPDVRVLTVAWYGKLAPTVYGRVTAGYLEQMYGGISGEVLWKPVNSRLALGVEANYVAQRNTDGGFGFDQFKYRIATGHVSGYLDLKNGFQAQLDVGRYLAGDVGGTFTLTRTFPTGWRVGAFVTLTNVSAKQFGEGSFDKGIIFEIPLAWFTGQPSRSALPYVLRPLGRDGGARLNVNDRLIETLRATNASGFDSQWGRFWK